MKKINETDYIKRFNNKHNNFYTYNKFPEKYNQKTDIEIICPVHGVFEQRIINHSNGMGCAKCAIVKRGSIKKKKSEIIYKDLLTEKYKESFDFSESDFSNGINVKIKVKCLKCNNNFYPTITDLNRDNHHCPHCRSINMKNGYYKNLSKLYEEKFITKATKIFNNRYDYSKTIYLNSITPVEIVCSEHGSFYKRPADHIYEPKLQGCPYCTAELNKSSHEEHVYNILLEQNIPFLFSYYERTDDYLKNKPFDFYISKYNLLIEVDGDQHRKISWNQSEDDFKKRLEIDKLKRERAKQLGYNILVLQTNEMYLTQLKKYLKKFNDYPNGDENSHQE